ncbi:MAG: glycosyltransferase family 2 protein [Caulobacteraceae bacterium]
MTTAPLVSLIMANYNGARSLAEAIASAQRQTLADWELILVDDASTDDSLAIAVTLAQADPRIKVLAQARNRGPAAASNRALAAARGAWIAVVDSDDVMLPERLERLVARAEAVGAEIVADDQLICDASLSSGKPFIGQAMARRLASVELKTFVDSSRLYSRLPDLGFLKPMVRAELVTRSGARYNESLRIGEDFHFLVALLATGARMHLEPEPLYLYRKHEASISHRFKPEVLAAMIAADTRVRASLADAAAARAMTRRIEGAKSWVVHEQVMAEAKAGRWLRAARTAAARPHAWRLITRPLRERCGKALRSPAPAAPLRLSAEEGA